LHGLLALVPAASRSRRRTRRSTSDQRPGDEVAVLVPERLERVELFLLLQVEMVWPWEDVGDERVDYALRSSCAQPASVMHGRVRSDLRAASRRSGLMATCLRPALRLAEDERDGAHRWRRPA
jgi:hypothetical protein